MEEPQIRVLVAKPGLDGHDRGAKVIARALRDAGMEVIYTGLRQTPEMIAEAALQEDVHIVGLSVLSGAHMTLVPRVLELLAHQGQAHVRVMLGGIIPDEDRPRLKEMEAAADAHRLPPAPCSNDLVPENLIDDGGRLWIVDYGYSGNNDPCSELGNACCEAGANQAEMESLCAAYFGAAEPRLLARMHLYAIMSDVAWSLWSVIQEHISDLPVDFQSYGSQRWERALALLHGPDLERWMREA